MNEPRFFAHSTPEAQLISEALDELRSSTGITGTLHNDANRADAKVSLKVAGKSLQYLCEVKRKIDRVVMLEDLKARLTATKAALLVCGPLTNAMAARCHELGIQFIDTAGNAYITDGEGILINVAGRRREKESLFAAREMTITPAALRMIFAFLADPSMLNAPYRDISMSVKVSTGAIGKVFETLEARGFIGAAPDGTRVINSPELLLSEWTAGYLSRLRPQLKKYRFTAPELDNFPNKYFPEFKISAWGGEMAAELHTKHLNPASFTIYMDMENPSVLTELVQRCRLRADPQGVIEIVQPFWNMDCFTDEFPTVPLHLVYADLLSTHDSRNLTVAQQIFRKIIDHVHNAKR
jgi:hypothetical protein